MWGVRYWLQMKQLLLYAGFHYSISSCCYYLSVILVSMLTYSEAERIYNLE